jgi:hypothetical protein
VLPFVYNDFVRRYRYVSSAQGSDLGEKRRIVCFSNRPYKLRAFPRASMKMNHMNPSNYYDDTYACRSIMDWEVKVCAEQALMLVEKMDSFVQIISTALRK